VSFFGELRRRNVFRVGIAYVATVWVLIQVADTVLPVVNASPWILQVLVFSSALGFPLALVLAWFYELTPEGIKVSADVDAIEPVRFMGRKLDFAIIGLLVVAVGFLLVRPPLDDQGTVLPNSIAILPFENLSPNPDDAYFAAGIHEEILNRLTAVRDLNVIARTSVMQYSDSPPSIPTIAKELRVQLVMVGSVRYEGDDVRITAQLIDGASNTHLWSEIYERKLTDIFAIQADLGTRIAAALEAEVLPRERESLQASSTDSTEAYGLFLRYTQTNSISRLERLRILDAAIEIDPNFALAYGHKALIYAELIRFPAGLLIGSEAESLSIENADRALALDSDIAIAHAALALIHEGYRRGAEALEEYELALELRPNDPLILTPYAALRRNMGDLQEAIEIGRRVVELDPKTSLGYHYLGHSYRIAGDIENATTNYELALALQPTNQGPLLQTANMAVIRGDYDTAVERLRLIEQHSRFIGNWQLPRLAYLYAKTGHSEDAKRLIAELVQRDQEAPVTPITWGFANVALGDYEEALIRFNQAIDDNEPGDVVLFNALKDNAFSDPMLENDPRFRKMRDRIPGF